MLAEHLSLMAALNLLESTVSCANEVPFTSTRLSLGRVNCPVDQLFTLKVLNAHSLFITGLRAALLTQAAVLLRDVTFV